MGAHYLMLNAGKIKVPKGYTFPAALYKKTRDWRLSWFVLMEVGVATIPSSGGPIQLLLSIGQKKLICRLHSVLQQHQQRCDRELLAVCRRQARGGVERSRAKAVGSEAIPVRQLRYSERSNHGFETLFRVRPSRLVSGELLLRIKNAENGHLPTSQAFLRTGRAFAHSLRLERSGIADDRLTDLVQMTDEGVMSGVHVFHIPSDPAALDKHILHKGGQSVVLQASQECSSPLIRRLSPRLRRRRGLECQDRMGKKEGRKASGGLLIDVVE